jgi:hypothetical protein
MINKPVKWVAALATSVSLLALAGCADKANPDNVDKRSVERWNYLSAHQAEKAYDFLSPGFRATQTRENYATAMNNRPVQWKGATFKSKQCDADRCKVEVDVTYSVTMPGIGKATEAKSPQSETWILVDGEWYYLPSN